MDTDMREEDIITIEVRLAHRNGDGSTEPVQQAFNRSWIVWPEDSGFTIPDYDNLLGGKLEYDARKVIDTILAWRRENHKHDNSDSNSSP